MLRETGWYVDYVESWQSGGAGAWVRKDLHGCIDIEMWKEGKVVGVQVCSASTVAAHRRKCCETIAELALFEKYYGIILLAWRKPKHRWEYRIEWIWGRGPNLGPEKQWRQP